MTLPTPISGLRFAGPAAAVLLALCALAGCAVDDQYLGSVDARRRGDAAPDGTPPLLATDLVALEIEPAAPVVHVVDGAPGTVRLTAFATQRDGRRVPAPTASFVLEHDRLGALDRDAVFTATGAAAGRVLVRAELVAGGPGGAPVRATATITVEVARTTLLPGAPADAAARFASPAPDPTAEARVLYPLDGAVMPNNVAAPDIQWERGAEGDVYRVTIAKPRLRLVWYLAHAGGAFRYDLVPARELWRLVADSDPDEPAVITVDRWIAAGTRAVSGSPVSVRLTHGGIFGNVYYWYWDNVSVGRVVRIDAATAARTEPIPSPPVAPPPSPSPRNACLGCHTISRDGRYLATGNHDGGLAVFDLTRVDLARNPAPTTFPLGAVPRGYFYSFNPDSTRLIVYAEGTGGFSMIDPLTGMSVAATGLPGRGAAHPEWAPDNSALAFIQSTDLLGDQHRNGDVALAPRVGPDAFGPARTLHTGASLMASPEGGAADSHPTFTPDARWIAFAHGRSAWSANSDVVIPPTEVTPGALYVVAATGGPAARMNRAMGGAAATDSYWPTFSPFTTVEPGENRRYYWLAFMSRREYGNAQAGTRGTRGFRLQLWVTAVDAFARPGEDASSVPYWLPGQDTATNNFGAVWAPTACRANGSECGASSECCSGRCLASPGAPGTRCQPATECRARGALCGGSGDCCPGLTCVGNVCDVPPPA